MLGLMTKAPKPEKMNFYSNAKTEAEEKALLDLEIPFDYLSPPHEDYLVKHTLWPELNKMYGHGYELVSVAVSKGLSGGGEGGERSRKLIASSCLSQTEKHSRVFLWDPETYQVVQELSGHEYTVLQVNFSPSDRFLCTVSRDRKIGIFERNEGKGADQEGSKLLYEKRYLKTAHNRLIFCSGFSHDEKYLVTGSRDKTIKIWKINASGENSEEFLTEILRQKFRSGITAAVFLDRFLDQENTQIYHLWLGFESGQVRVVTFDANTSKLATLGVLPPHFSHSTTVNRLAVRGQRDLKNIRNVTVASCSDDHSTRIYEYHFYKPKIQKKNTMTDIQ